MSSLKLVSAGDDIKIWDCRSFGLIKSFDPHDQNISGVCWSNCGKFVASCSEEDDKLAITHIQNSAQTSLELDIEKGCLCVDFDTKSKYLLCGGADCVVNVWDLKTRKLKKSFKEHKSAVTSVSFNWNDAYIASGSKSGDIILHNLITGQSMAPLKAPKVQAIKQLQYHYFRKSLFASASDDGAVNLWDANTRQLKHSFDVHKAPATGLTFSPINEMLLISVGLDKRIALYDVCRKKNLQVLTADGPLTSIDVMSDGGTLAVGTTRGKIQVYDIRVGPNSVQMFNAHSSPISTLSFHPKSNVNSKDSAESESKKRDASSNIKSKPSTLSSGDSASISQPASQAVRAKPTTVITKDVFSPIRDNTGLQSSASFIEDSLLTTSSNVNSSETNTLGAYGVFSPLQGASSNGMGFKSSLGNSPLIGNSFLGASSAVISPVNGNYSVSSYQNDSSINGYSGSSHIQQHGISASPSLPQLRVQQSYTNSPGTDSVDGTGASNGKHVKFTDQNSHNSSGEIQDCRQDLRSEIQGAWQDSNTSPKTEPVADVSGRREASLFQTEFIRNLVKESQEELRDEIHQDLLNLHMEMLRQFHVQQLEMKSMMEELSVKNQLVREVEELREENKKLKKLF